MPALCTATSHGAAPALPGAELGVRDRRRRRPREGRDDSRSPQGRPRRGFFSDQIFFTPRILCFDRVGEFQDSAHARSHSGCSRPDAGSGGSPGARALLRGSGSFARRGSPASLTAEAPSATRAGLCPSRPSHGLLSVVVALVVVEFTRGPGGDDRGEQALGTVEEGRGASEVFDSTVNTRTNPKVRRQTESQVWPEWVWHWEGWALGRTRRRCRRHGRRPGEFPGSRRRRGAGSVPGRILRHASRRTRQ